MRGGLAPLLALALAAVVLVATDPISQEPSPGAAVITAQGFAIGSPRFEVNQGQADPSVRFLTRAPGYQAAFMPGGAVFSLALPRAEASQAPRADVVRMGLVGGEVEPEMVGLERLAGSSNHLRGDDPAGWHTEVPNYAQVAYRQVYPGIDLVFHGEGGALEYDFVVAPGADPGQIALSFGGAEHVALDGAGDLVLTTPGGAELVSRAPFTYQERHGQRHEVASAYAIDDGRVSFSLGAHDPDLPLVIDPVIAYASFLGDVDAGNDDVAQAIAVDASGNAYVTGYTSGDFSPLQQPAQPVFGGSGPGSIDAFVAKFDPDGNLVYSTYLGGSDREAGVGIAVDASGNAWVTGSTRSPDFPIAGAAFQADFGDPQGGTDAFLARFDPDGALTYSTYLGGVGNDFAQGIAVSGDGAVYLAGASGTAIANTEPVRPRSLDFPGVTDAFVAKFSGEGALSYFTYLGGVGQDFAGGIAVDGDGNAHVVGTARSPSFPNTESVTARKAGSDTFVARLDGAGALSYLTFVGGSGDDEAGVEAPLSSARGGIGLDSAGQAWVTGRSTSNDLATTDGAVVADPGGAGDGFVARIDPDGSTSYLSYLGGAGDDRGHAVAVDSADRVHLTGETSSADFAPAPSPDALQPDFGGGESDVFVVSLDATGSLLSSTYLGGSERDNGFGIAADAAGNLYLAGSTRSVEFPVSDGAVKTDKGNNSDGFVARILVEDDGTTTTTVDEGSTTTTVDDGSTTTTTVNEGSTTTTADDGSTTTTTVDDGPRGPFEELREFLRWLFDMIHRLFQQFSFFR